mgnify:CR=1 FL=1
MDIWLKIYNWSYYVNYEKMVEDYNATLLTKLRSHGSELDYLEMWVPDEDPVKCILNMVEAADAYGSQELNICVKKDTLNDKQLTALAEEVEKIANLELDKDKDKDKDKTILNILFQKDNAQELLKNIHPSLHQGIMEIAGQLEHYGELKLFDGEDEYIASAGNVSLKVSVKNGTICKALFQGDMEMVQKVVLEVFCRIIEELPVQEAADHGALKTLYKLCNRKLEKPVSGILMVENAGEIFKKPEFLIRKINEEYRIKNGIIEFQNFWVPHLSKDWLKLSEAGKIDRLQPILDGFIDENKLAPNDIKIASITKDIRLTVYFSKNVLADRKPVLLLNLELKMRESTGKQLEIYMQEEQDANKLRRIKVN